LNFALPLQNQKNKSPPFLKKGERQKTLAIWPKQKITGFLLVLFFHRRKEKKDFIRI